MSSNIFRSFAATKLRTVKHLLVIKHLRKSEAGICRTELKIAYYTAKSTKRRA